MGVGGKRESEQIESVSAPLYSRWGFHNAQLCSRSLFTILPLKLGNTSVPLSRFLFKHIHILLHKQQRHILARRDEFQSAPRRNAKIRGLRVSNKNKQALLLQTRRHQRRPESVIGLIRPTSAHAAHLILGWPWVRAAAPSSLTRKKTNIWSLLIPLKRGATEAKVLKNAGNAAAVVNQPVGPPQIQLFPSNSNPSSHHR